MKSVLILNRDMQLIDYLDFLVKGTWECRITKTTKFDRAVEILENKKFDLIISDESITSKILPHLQKENKKTLFFIMCHEEKIGFSKEKFHEFCDGVFSYEKGGDLIDCLNDELEKEKSSYYCHICIEDMYNFKTFPADFYLRLSVDKYVKVFNRGDVVKANELARFQNEKRVKDLYLSDADYILVLKEIVKNMEVPTNNRNQVARRVKKMSRNVTDMVKSLGVTHEGVVVTNEIIDQVLNLVDKHDNVMKELGELVIQENYINEHSFLLSYIACAIADKTQWAGKETRFKLCLSSFFHDISLSSTDAAKVDDLTSWAFLSLSPDQQKDVRVHMFNACTYLQSIDGVPLDVFKIIKQHHERPDGTGFPRGLGYDNIAPLAAIFIVAHEIVDCIWNKGADRNHIRQFVDELDNSYSRGSFKYILDAVIKVFDLEEKKIYIEEVVY